MSAASVAVGVVGAPLGGASPVDAAWRRGVRRKAGQTSAAAQSSVASGVARVLPRLLAPWVCVVAVVVAGIAGVIAGTEAGARSDRSGEVAMVGSMAMVEEHWVMIPEGATLWDIVTTEYPTADPRAAIVAVRRANQLPDDATLQVGARIRLPRTVS